MEKEIIKIVKQALHEDIGKGDITTKEIIPKNLVSEAVIKCNSDGILAGVFVAKKVFELLDPEIEYEPLLKDGEKLTPDTVIVRLKGKTRAILTGERTALNFLGRLSGIATLVDKFVRKVKKYGTKILDTRKTTPGLRVLEKYAVRVGGGLNHRMGLYDGFMLKDNHKKVLGGIVNALKQMKNPKDAIVEVDNLEELKKALQYKVKRIMLDNFNIEDIKKAIELAKYTGIELEVSGGVGLHNIEDIAKLGIKYISIGAITHQATWIDFSLDII